MDDIITSERQSILRYRPLEINSREIRILLIRPQKLPGKIDCCLEHASLDTYPIYNALSYTWGDQADTTELLIDGCRFPVTRRLATALEHLCSQTETARFWIDAICINQNDLQERSYQVQCMKAIYEQAQEVVVWLGPEAEDSGYAMKAIDMTDERWTTRNPEPKGPLDLTVPALSDRALSAIDRLLDRDWWCRVWIIQEATSPNETYLLCGRCKTKFTKVIATVNIVVYHKLQQALRDNFQTPDLERFQRVISLDQIRLERIHPNKGLDLLSLLDESRIRQATNLRDKLYALFGLATDVPYNVLKPDYSRPVNQAYLEFVENIMRIQGNLNVLGHCAGPESPHSPLRCLIQQPLPSWVPDWSTRLDVTPLAKNQIHNKASTKRVYSASDSYPLVFQLLSEPRIMIIRGFTFDTVLKLAVNYSCIFESSTLQLWKEWVLQCLGETYQETNTNKKRNTAETTTCDAFLRTVVADIGQTGKRLSKDHSALSWPLDISSKTGHLIRRAVNGRGLFISKLGYMGLARYDVVAGDRICILHGGHVPFILKREGRHHRLKGECYIHGLMDGEAMDYPRVWQDFPLR